MDARCIAHIGIGKVELRSTAVRDPKPGEVLIETEYSCVSPGTELRVLGGKEDGQKPWPFVPGYSMAGTIIKSGAGVGLKPGTRVAAGGTADAAGMNLQWGAHISHAVTPAANVIPLPENVSTLHAVGARLAAIPYHGFLMAGAQPGDRVAVIGLGVIGLCAAKLYAIHDCKVMAIDRSAARVDRAVAWDINGTVSEETATDTIRRTFEQGVDFVVDATGVPAVAADAIGVLRDLPWDDAPASPAKYVVQGSYESDMPIPYHPIFFAEGQVLFPRNTQLRDIKGVIHLAASGKLDLSPIVADVRSPDDAPGAYKELGDPRTAPLTVAFKWK